MLRSWSNGIKFSSTCMSKEIISHGRSDPKVEEQNTQCHCNPTKIAVCKLRGEVGKQKKFAQSGTRTLKKMHTHTHTEGGKI
jgi:hypothetical protein